MWYCQNKELTLTLTCKKIIYLKLSSLLISQPFELAKSAHIGKLSHTHRDVGILPQGMLTWHIGLLWYNDVRHGKTLNTTYGSNPFEDWHDCPTFDISLRH